MVNWTLFWRLYKHAMMTARLSNMDLKMLVDPYFGLKLISAHAYMNSTIYQLNNGGLCGTSS